MWLDLGDGEFWGGCKLGRNVVRAGRWRSPGGHDGSLRVGRGRRDSRVAHWLGSWRTEPYPQLQLLALALS